jgi:hypothetical protein
MNLSSRFGRKTQKKTLKFDSEETYVKTNK